MIKKSDWVTIIIRTKDRPDFLSRSLESVYSQDYEKIEIIVVNDNGVDVLSVIDHFRNLPAIDGLERKVEYVVNSRSLFRAAAANVGLSVATGKYIGFLDDDDYFMNNHVSTHVEAMKRSGKMASVSSALESIEKFDGKIFIEKERHYIFPRQINKLAFFFFENFFPFNSVMFRKDVIDKVGRFDENIFVLEDWDFLIRLMANYDFHRIEATTAVFTTRSDNSNIRKSSKDDKLWRDAFMFIQKKNKLFFDKGQVTVPLSEVSEFLSLHAAEWYTLTKENDSFLGSWIYKVYKSTPYALVKKIGKKLGATRA